MGLIYYDIPELQGTETEVVLSNLISNEKEIEKCLEKRIAHLSELTDAIIVDGGERDIINSIILSLKSDSPRGSENITVENNRQIENLFAQLSPVERAFIFKQICANLDGNNYDLLTEGRHHVSNRAKSKISYLKSSYNDRAYIQFSSLLPHAKAYYCNSVTEVVDSVVKDECEFCILPIETSKDGKLISFYNLILNLGLKINSTCELIDNDGRVSTKYALLSKNVFIESIALNNSNNKLFEFVIEDSGGNTLKDILVASKIFSCRLERIDTLNILIDGDEKTSLLCPVLNVCDADINALLYFLDVDYSDYIPIGLYIKI